ncbi:MAG: hypothetical protein ACKVOH_03560 [Chlamydiales bacterium]
MIIGDNLLSKSVLEGFPRSERMALSILEALDNLNALVDADSLHQIEVTDDAHLIVHKREERENYWLGAAGDEQTLDAIRETFRTVHEYLTTFYAKMRKSGESRRLMEGINTVMVLVGEAAQKLEKYGTIFKKNITEIEEYKSLQDFYRTKVVKELFGDFAKAPLQKKVEGEREKIFSADEEVDEIGEVHILNDIEVIRKDHLYELFYLKNEAGHDFFTYKLARNIKLACDFTEFFGKYVDDDPLLQVKNWEDRGVHILAKKILHTATREIKKFYQEAHQYREMELVVLVHFSIMALLLAANPRNLIRQFSGKGCHLYFNDFQSFLRAILYNRDYQRFLVYLPPEEAPFFHDVMQLIFALTEEFFLLGSDMEEVKGAIGKIVSLKPHGKEAISEDLMKGYRALDEVFSRHPSGPVFKAVDIIRESNERCFDPLMQGNIPTYECSIDGIILMRMPCPVRQQFIHQAEIAEEFKTYLRALILDKKVKCHLIFNFQDRTSWREHARSVVLEELARNAEFASVLRVVTMAIDTDFYNQTQVYAHLEESEQFLAQFYEHLSEEGSGYYFPTQVKNELFSQWAKQLFTQIHTVFFAGKGILSVEERRDFISIAHQFIELKIIEIIDPNFLSHCSKDGLDSSGVATAGLIALLKQEWKEGEREQLLLILFGPTMLHRERVVHPERFYRLESMIERLENCENYRPFFAKLYSSKVLGWNPQLL